jgi:hypothetical protein
MLFRCLSGHFDLLKRLLLPVTFINQLSHSITAIAGVKIYVIQTPTTHIISTIEPLYVISIKYSLSLPYDGSCVI